MAILLSRDGTEIKGAGNVTELSAENKNITNLADPVNGSDAATKDYVDASAGTATNAQDGTFTIDNTADPTKQIDFDASGISAGNRRTIIMPDADVNLGLVNTAIQSSQKGAANGVAPLNALAKIDATYLPSYVDDVEEYANFAALPVTGESGKIYVTLDDNKVYRWSGSVYIEVSPSEVISVNGQSGAVTLDSDDIAEASTNLYFTDARAKAAAVADSITDGVTDVAPSQNAVFDALALKAEASDTGKSFDLGTMGESFAANQIWLVRRAKSGETAGRYYKAQADSFANARVVGYIIVDADALIAGNVVKVYKLGEAALGSSDTGFGSGNINAPVYLHQSTPGKFTLSPTSTSGAILKPVGYVGNDLVLEFQPEITIQA